MSPARKQSGEGVARAAEILGQLARAAEPIAQRSTYRVGGRAALYVEIDSAEDLATVCTAVGASQIAVLVLGGGSNLLISEAGFPGLCIGLGEHFGQMEITAEAAQLHAGGAVAYPVLARQSVAAGLAGMEWAVGIPGSVGGAVAMNAGGHGSQTADHLLEARIIRLSSGEERVASPADLELSYRHSNLAADDLVLGATFSLSSGPRAQSEQALDEVVAWRRAHQPGGRNGGSVFTNPPGDAAGRLIEAAGLKGMRLGSATVSDKHANFFLVDKDGKADDVFALISTVAGLVAERCGVALSTELRLIGFER